MKYVHCIIILLVLYVSSFSQESKSDRYVFYRRESGFFPLFDSKIVTPLVAGAEDFPGVIRALGDLQSDLEKVTKHKPLMYRDTLPKAKNIVIIGTFGKSKLIERLVASKKLNIEDIKAKWEAFIVQVVKKPLPGIDQALVIVGSDKRGTIFGIYDLCEQIGVSPWYWWADVVPEKRDFLFVKPGRYMQSPSVRYRGIFLNDEYPNLTRWVAKKYGMVTPSENPPIPNDVANYNSKFYARIFEVILRLKGNYLWPAMWNNAFNEDDPENARLADEYGIVMGTSHQEPMIRAQKEWDRRYQKTLGYWNYAKYPDTIKNFWREGIRRNKNFESIITIGLRGANDTEMAPGGPEENKTLLENIVEEQRKIIAEEMDPDVTKVPQAWCLYKEVLDYYKAGMRVPDDVTLLWAEDNWGNVRRLPTPEERKRSGGAGVYYHFDYHGGPRSYQWINTSPIPKIWDQMALSKQYGADRIWIVNVGHFKGYEFPMEYFLKLGWNSEKWTNSNLMEFTKQWAAREFGEAYAGEIAHIMSQYSKFNGRRKPELLTPSTYSLIHYCEAERVIEDYNAITAKAEEIFKKIPKEKQDAYYQLILFPTKASALVNELYLAAARNALYARQGRASANYFATETQRLFTADTSLMGYYNRQFANGRWNHFMDQAHLGYTSWNDPPVNSLRAIKLTENEIPDIASMGLVVEGSDAVWPEYPDRALLPSFDKFNRQKRYFEIFNKGTQTFDFKVECSKPWIVASESTGTITKDTRIWVAIDWEMAPKGFLTDSISVIANHKRVSIHLKIVNPSNPSLTDLQGFVEGAGYVSMEAEHYTRNLDAGSSKWIKIEDYGHTLSGMRASAEANAPAADPGKNAPCLEYRMYLFSSGVANVQTICSPVLNFMPDRAIRYAVSVDNEPAQIVTLVPEKYDAQNGNRDWEKSVSDNARFGNSKHNVSGEGYHTLKIWMIDPGVVIQKIVVDFGGVKPSYLGPPESFYKK
jgi:hypothetical protein